MAGGIGGVGGIKGGTVDEEAEDDVSGGRIIEGEGGSRELLGGFGDGPVGEGFDDSGGVVVRRRRALALSGAVWYHLGVSRGITNFDLGFLNEYIYTMSRI